MKTALITGANRGIGLQMALQLSNKGYHVIAACRQTSTELDALNCQIETGFDVTNAASIKGLSKKLAATQLDVLINNAGILASMGLDDLDYSEIRRQFETNALAPLRVTETFLPQLSRGSKVAIITSRMGSVMDNTSGGQYGYRMSKAAVNMAGASLAQDLKPRGISVVLLHPGYVRTGMTGGSGLIEADESARGLIARIEKLNLENTGSFWHADGSILPW